MLVVFFFVRTFSGKVIIFLYCSFIIFLGEAIFVEYGEKWLIKVCVRFVYYFWVKYVYVVSELLRFIII